MFGLLSVGTINWKDAAQNLVIVLIGFAAGAYIGYKLSITVAETMLEQQKSLIEKAIDKETIKNEILNKIEIKDNKFKKNDSLNINIHQIPNNNQKPINVIIKKVDSIPINKKSWWKRTFGKKDKKNK